MNTHSKRLHHAARCALLVVFAAGTAGFASAARDATVTQPGSGSTLSSHSIRPSGSTFDASAPIPTGTSVTATVAGIASSASCTATTNAARAWQCTAPVNVPADGAYSVSATVTQADSSQGAPSTPINFNVNTTPTLTQPSGGVTNSARPVFGGTKIGDGTVVRVCAAAAGQCSSASSACNRTGLAAAPGSWSCTAPGTIASGSYVAHEIDSAGGFSGPSAPFSVTVNGSPATVNNVPLDKTFASTPFTLSGTCASGETVTAALFAGASAFPSSAQQAKITVVCASSAWSGSMTLPSNTLQGGLTLKVSQVAPDATTAPDTVVTGITVDTRPTAPGAPIIGIALAGSTRATIAFAPPGSNGGAAITNYTVTSIPGGLIGGGTASPIVVNGLSNGVPYTFTVTATNSVGTGGASGASNSIVPHPDVHDFNADAKPDVVWSNTSNGATYLWYMNGPALVNDAFVTQIDPSWKIQGVADFNGDGHPDLVWRNTGNGNTYLWYMNGTTLVSDVFLFSLPPEWVIQGVADFNGDGKPDFLMRNTNTGVAFVWFFNDAAAIGDQFLFGIDPVWKVEAVADLDADGQPDLLFRNMRSGLAFAWSTAYRAGSLSLAGSSAPIFGIDPVWEIAQMADWDGDGQPDLLFRNRDTGLVFVWYLVGTTLGRSDAVTQIDPSWEIVPRR